MIMNPKNRFWIHCGFAIVIAAAVYLSDLLVRSQTINIAPIWPVAGISFACLLLLGLSACLAIVAGIVLGILLSPVEMDVLFYTYAITANVFGPVTAYGLVRNFKKYSVFSFRLDTGLLLTCAAVVMSAVEATVGSIGLIHVGSINSEAFIVSWWLWFLGDFFGAATCLMPVLTIAMTFQHPKWVLDDVAHKRYFEKAVWIAAVIFAGYIWFLLGQVSPTYSLALTFLPITLLGWNALRFDHLFVSVSVMVLCLSMAVFVAMGMAGFVPSSEPLDNAVLLIFLSMVAILPMFVSAASFRERHMAAKLEHRASHDYLTGLPNRVAFEKKALIAENAVRDASATAALCYLDLDSFKVVNDACGHQAGDELLQQVSHVLLSQMTDKEFIARLGGDEFGIIFCHCSMKHATERSQELIELIDDFRFVRQQQVFAMTASAGLAAFDHDNPDYMLTLSEADAASFEAKELGGNRLVISSEQHNSKGHSTHAMRQAMQITEALERNRFELFCQHIVPLVSGSADHFGLTGELLLRMRDNNNQVLSPKLFLPTAERFKMTPKIDRWVIRRMIQWFDQHPKHARELDSLSINLSGLSIGDPSFLEYLLERLHQSSIPCEKLCFEITETAAIGELGNAVKFIDAVRECGCRFALDDFGSGLSSFGYLKALHVDTIKIDGNFVRDLLTNRVDYAMVKSINEVAQIMGKTTVAEYVENMAIAEILVELGVDFAQGHAFGRPVPIHEFFEQPFRHQQHILAQGS